MAKTTPGFWNQFWTKLPVAYRGALIIGIPVIAILPAIAGWNWSNKVNADANRWISHTQDVIRESNSLIGAILEAETGVRGYTITQKSEFLEPYNQAIKEIPVNIEELEKSIQDNPQQQQRLKEIERQITSRLNLLTQILNQLKTSKEFTPQFIELFISGKVEMDRVRNSVNILKAEEWRLLNIRQRRLKQVGQITEILQWTTVGFNLIGYIVAIKLYYRAENELNAKLKELALSNNNLVETNQLVKKRNQELDRFTYVVSHDLKAPLRAISNLSTWIEEDLEGELEEDTKDNLILLRNRVQRMNNFIDGLLEYSRAGKVKAAKSTVDVSQLLSEIIDSLAPSSAFTISIDDKMPLLHTEAILLQQVFSNLISNAIKHHDRDRGNVKISVEEREPYYLFSVADNGGGIAAEHQEKIFEIFQTLRGKDATDSTGIGLSIVKKIVENQGGKIWLESELGMGSTFFFTWSK